jgi:hypothetical protein
VLTISIKEKKGLILEVTRIDLIDTHNFYAQDKITKPIKVTLDDNNKVEKKKILLLEPNEFELSAKLFDFNLQTLLFEYIPTSKHSYLDELDSSHNANNNSNLLGANK